MLKQHLQGRRWATSTAPPSPPCKPNTPSLAATREHAHPPCTLATTTSSTRILSVFGFRGARHPCTNHLQLASSICCSASRRSVRYGSDDEEEDGEVNGHNEEIAMLELYSQSARGEALLVHAMVDEEEVQVLVYKGFSSSLSHETSPDPSKSVLPAKAKIKSIDRIKGPFDPSNIDYIAKGLAWESFKQVLLNN